MQLISNHRIMPHVMQGDNVLVAAHGNSLRSIIMQLDDLSPEEVPLLELETGVPIVYDNYFWSGKHKRAVKGINLIALYYTDKEGNSYPVNFRIYDKQESKTKNDYFREMVLEVIQWKLEPAWIHVPAGISRLPIPPSGTI